MLFVSVADFYAEAEKSSRLTREEEKQYARAMEHDPAARDKLRCSYLPQVAAQIRHAPREIQTLKTVYACLATLEKGVDGFNFLQDSESFSHHLSWRLRQCVTRCLAEQS
jgi:hypothetical protein